VRLLSRTAKIKREDFHFLASFLLKNLENDININTFAV